MQISLEFQITRKSRQAKGAAVCGGPVSEPEHVLALYTEPFENSIKETTEEVTTVRSPGAQAAASTTKPNILISPLSVKVSS